MSNFKMLAIEGLKLNKDMSGALGVAANPSCYREIFEGHVKQGT